RSVRSRPWLVSRSEKLQDEEAKNPEQTLYSRRPARNCTSACVNAGAAWMFDRGAADPIGGEPALVRRRHEIVGARDDERRYVNPMQRLPLVHVAHGGAGRDVAFRRRRFE